MDKVDDKPDDYAHIREKKEHQGNGILQYFQLEGVSGSK